MAFTKLVGGFNIEYDDKEDGQIIDPSEWNKNFNKIEDKINGYNALDPSESIQGIVPTVNANYDKLSSTTVDDSGASLIGTELISGLVGTNVQTVLESTKTLIDTNAATASTGLNTHTARTDNPHSVTASQIPLTVVGIDANKVDTAILELKGLDDLKLPISTAASTYETITNANNLIKNVTLNSNTGTFTFTRQDNTTFTIDTALEEIPTTMKFYENPVGSGTYYLGIYDKDDHLISSVNVTALFNPITVSDTDTIDLTQETSAAGIKTITADVKDGSIGETQLTTSFKSRVTTLETEQLNDVNAKSDTDRIAITLTAGTNGKTISADIVDHSIGATQIDSTYMTTINQAVLDAQTAETNAETAATNANTYKTQAGTSATNAAASELNASGYATAASGSATTASNKATEAGGYATSASTSSTTASNKATLSESWAVGGTGTRTGENTNNAKYWCEQAGQIAGGQFVTSVNNIAPAGTASGPITIDADDIGSTGTTNQFVTSEEKSAIASNSAARHTHANSEVLAGITSDNLVTTSEKSTWNAKYDKPSGGIPDTDIASASTWNAKQDALPTVANDRYLHTNSSTGALEWSQVSLPADMTGATASTGGTHGLVPAPSAGDQDKCLRGDGTWGAVSASTTGTIASGQAVSTAVSGYGNFGYKCDLTVNGVTANSYCIISFGANDSIAGKLAPFCETSANTITIFASESYTTVDALTYVFM